MHLPHFAQLPTIVLAWGIFCSTASSPTASWEVFAFVLKCPSSVWLKFDWTRLTTIAMFGTDNTDPALIRHAHQHNVRAVFVTSPNETRLTDKTYRRRWIRSQVRHALRHGFDGINVDFEAPLASGSAEIPAFTALIKEMSANFHRDIPGSQVSVDVAWSPNCIDGRCYDYASIARNVDLLFVMSYDEQSQMWDQRTCTARANAPLRQTFSGIRKFLSPDLRIPRHKLVLGTPWYGYVYPCQSLDENDACRIASVPFHGCNCSDAAGSQMAYDRLTSRLLPLSDNGVQWDADSQTPYFNFRHGAGAPWQQVWFDDPRSLRTKYLIARDMGLGGVGMWTANFLDYGNATQVADMWGAIPTGEATRTQRPRLIGGL